MTLNYCQKIIGSLAFATALLSSAISFAEETVVVSYQQIVGPFITAIADGSFDAAAQEAGYKIEWRQLTTPGEVSVALASGRVAIGTMGSTGIAATMTRGVDIELFWVLDNIGKSEALVGRESSGMKKPSDIVGKKVAVPFVSTSHFHLLVGMEEVWNINPRDVTILNLTPPQIAAAWQRGDIDAAYVWPPALSELLKNGTILADSEEVGAASVPTFDGIVVDKGWAREHPEFMKAFTKVLTKAYADYKENSASWTVDSDEVKGIVKMIGGNPTDIVEALQLLGFPTLEEQLSKTWLGGGAESGAVRAFAASAAFLKAQKQIDTVLPDYESFVNASYATAAE